MIHIYEDFYMKADKFCWILIQGHVATEKDVENSKKNRVNLGDFVEDRKTYHMTIQDLLERVLEHCRYRKTKKKDMKTIEEYINEIKELQKDFFENTKEFQIYASKLNLPTEE